MPSGDVTEAVDAAVTRVLEATDAAIEKVKSPPEGEITQSVYIRVATEALARELATRLNEELPEYSKAKSAEDGWADHPRQPMAGVNCTVDADYTIKYSDRVVVTVVPVPDLGQRG